MKRIIDVGLRIKGNFVEGARASLDSNISIVAAGVVGVIAGVKEESVKEGITAAYGHYLSVAGLTGLLYVILGEVDNLKGYKQ